MVKFVGSLIVTLLVKQPKYFAKLEQFLQGLGFTTYQARRPRPYDLTRVI